MFTPYNPNPRGINTGDCVIRAICRAMDKTWEKVYTELTVKGLQEVMWDNYRAKRSVDCRGIKGQHKPCGM